MNVLVVGSGYVGLVTAACAASRNHRVTCLDTDEEKLARIERKQAPFFEPGLQELLDENGGKTLFVSRDLKKAVRENELILLCVPTPSKKNGEIELRFLKKAVQQVGRALRSAGAGGGKQFKVIAIRSTVLPGTTKDVVIPLLEKTSGLATAKDFGVAMNPEFLREGAAVKDFLEPDKIVVGALDEASARALKEFYAGFNAPFVETDLNTAELVKYANNAFLAARVSLINEFSRACEAAGVDVGDVARAIGLDKRIGPLFLEAGAGFGGSCFRKDLLAMVKAAKKMGFTPRVMQAVLETNEAQAMHAIGLLEKEVGPLAGKRVCVLGLAFKPNTDDVRDSPSLKIISRLLEEGAVVAAHDPKAVANAKKFFAESGGSGREIIFADTVRQALEGADGCLIVTQWPEYKGVLEHAGVMKQKIVVDCRRIIDARKAREAGVKLKAVGRGKN